MRPSNGGKGDDRRPGEGYDEGHERAFGVKPPKPQWVPPPLPDWAKKPEQKEA